MLVVDLAIRLKNGYLAKKDKITVLYSKLNENVVSILKKEGYIADYEIKNQGKNKKLIEVILSYKKGKPAVTEVKIISKPGRRIYSQVKDLKPVLGGLGIAILTTPKGVMTDKEARKNKVGGEVLFQVW